MKVSPLPLLQCFPDCEMISDSVEADVDAQVKGHGVEKGVLFSRKLIISFIFSL